MKATVSSTGVFADFILEVTGGSLVTGNSGGRRYTITSVSSTGGKAASALDFDPAGEPLSTQLVQVAGTDPDTSIRETVGQALFELLFRGSVRDLWTTAKT